MIARLLSCRRGRFPFARRLLPFRAGFLVDAPALVLGGIRHGAFERYPASGVLLVPRRSLACGDDLVRGEPLGRRSRQVGNQKLLMKLGGWKGAKEWEASRRGVWFAGTRDGDNGQGSRTVGYVKVRCHGRASACLGWPRYWR